jgi:hypothetical protein
MKHQLIKREDYLLVIDDEGITGFENNIWVIQGNRLFLWQNTMALVFSFKPKKIIAHLPLNGFPYLDDVDVLPEIESEVYQLAETFITWNDNLKYSTSRSSFIQGYNKAKQTYKYTEEDMIEFAVWRSITDFDEPHTPLGEFKIWESLNQPKLPIAFECGMKEYGQYDCGVFMKDDEEQIKITNSEGRTEWVGKYLF